MIKNVKIGCDPEMFLFSEKDNKFVPVVGLVGGTKKKPLPITDNGHSLQEDNVMVEFTIPPCVSSDEFIDNINFVKNYIQESVLNPLNLQLKIVASARFKIKDLRSRQAQEFGCDPDFNAWTFEMNTVERTDMLLRSAGGHIHIGYDDPNDQTSIELIRALDLFIGVPSLFLDSDVERRKLYGRAGAFRFKSYGVEYRVPSNFWIENNELIKWAFDSTMNAIAYINSGSKVLNGIEVQEAINNNNYELAENILKNEGIQIPQLLTIK